MTEESELHELDTTEEEKAAAFEWLRTVALDGDRHAVVALMAWAESMSGKNASVGYQEKVVLPLMTEESDFFKHALSELLSACTGPYGAPMIPSRSAIDQAKAVLMRCEDKLDEADTNG